MTRAIARETGCGSGPSISSSRSTRSPGTPPTVVDELWHPIAEEQRQRLERDEPLTHRLRELPGVSRRSMALLGPIDSLLVDG